jgi:GTPase SAR1 family protein
MFFPSEVLEIYIVFVIGTAGSGKSLLTASYSNWLKNERQDVITVNLDPAVTDLPYIPDVDVRDFVQMERIQEYGLGPNGALILAADLIAEEAERIGNEVESLRPDIAIIDTAGQMELFAFRASGPYIVQELTKDPKAIIYLFDSVFSYDPINYVSNLFLSAAVYTRFLRPQIHVLSKCDLLPEEEVEKIVGWSTEAESLEEAINRRLTGTRRLLGKDLMQTIYRLGLNFSSIPISAKTNEGMINLNGALERVFTSGEKYTL